MHGQAGGYVALAAGTPQTLRAHALELSTLENPEWVRRKQRGLYLGKTPRNLCFAEVCPDGRLAVPIGAAQRAAREHTPALDFGPIKPAATPAAMRATAGLRPYQRRVIDAVLKAGRSGLIVAPCGSGKTRIGLALAASIAPAASPAALHRPILVIVHTRELLAQWSEEAARIFGAAAVATVSGGKASGGSTAAVWVALVQSAAAIPPEVRQYASVLLVDECHHTSAKTYRDLVGLCAAPYRYGLTATPARADGLGQIAEIFLGQVLARIEPGELQAEGHTAPFQFFAIDTGWWYPWEAGEPLHELILAMVANEPRNATITALAAAECKQGRPTLVVTGRVDHAQHLAHKLHEQGVDAHALTGAMRAADRAAVVARMRAGVPIVVCATTVADEGLDWPTLATLILATPSRAAGRMVQRCGRVMRIAEGKGRPRVYDLVDDVAVLRGQAAARRKAIAELRAGA